MESHSPSLNGLVLPTRLRPELPPELIGMLKGGLALLWREYTYAGDIEPGRWTFSLDLGSLADVGLSAIDVQWLLTRGYLSARPATHRTPVEGGPAKPGRVDPEGNTCYTLTDAGAAFAWDVLTRANGSPRPPAARPPVPAAVPCWDVYRKELRFGSVLVKQFRWAAMNQETILMAFEEEHWPERIDDPLPPKADGDAKQRLHDTIKCLNRNHKSPAIRFSGDGTGEGVIWAAVAADPG